MKKVTFTMIFIFAFLSFASLAMAQNDMQDAKASLLGAGVKFSMDKPSMKARNLSSTEDEKTKEAINYDCSKGGLLENTLNGGGQADEGVRTRPIKDTKLICEVCKAKAVLNANENCEFCKGKSYADLCDKCIAWSILNSCDECKKKVQGKTASKSEKAKETAVEETKAAEEKEIKKDENKDEEITADDTEAKPVKKAKSTKKAKSNKKAKKAAKKVKTEKVEEPVVE